MLSYFVGLFNHFLFDDFNCDDDYRVSLADAVEKILTPLKLIKVPHMNWVNVIYEFGLFQPLVDDTNRIMNAQRARGVDFGEGNLLKGIRSFIPILIPICF